MQEIVRNHYRRDDSEENDQWVEHGYWPDFLEIVIAEKRQENGQANHKDGNI